MAGHSKWANIKHRKGKADAAKGKAFTRASKEIITSAKLGGIDPKSNVRLRLAIQKAREVNLPNDNIERCLSKAQDASQAAYEEVRYELYGYGGVGIIVDAMTDNRNRLASDIRIVINKRGGTQAQPGAVAFNFDCYGVVRLEKRHAIEDELFATVTEAGADDFIVDDDEYTILSSPTAFPNVKAAVEKLGFPCDEASLEMVPKLTVACSEEHAAANSALIEGLEAIDDVDSVYHNME